MNATPAGPPAPLLSVVVPVYNEEGNLPALLGRTLAALSRLPVPAELVLVDDGSADASPRLIADAARAHPGRVVAVLKPRNEGQHPAILSGFAAARGRLFVTLDADLQNPPEEIARVFAELQDGADVVGTIRRNRQDAFFRRFASAAVNLLVRAACRGAAMHDYGCMLRGYSRDIVDRLLAAPAQARFIPLRAMVFARHPVEIEVSHAERTSGTSKYGFPQLVRLFGNLFLTLFPPSPSWSPFLRFATSGLLSFGVDLALFHLLVDVVFHWRSPAHEIFWGTLVARILSSILNYALNHRAVFRSDAPHATALLRYYILWGLLLLASSRLVICATALWPELHPTVAKIPVDLALFLASYVTQRGWVFRR